MEVHKHPHQVSHKKKWTEYRYTQLCAADFCNKNYFDKSRL